MISLFLVARVIYVCYGMARYYRKGMLVIRHFFCCKKTLFCLNGKAKAKVLSKSLKKTCEAGVPSSSVSNQGLNLLFH